MGQDPLFQKLRLLNHPGLRNDFFRQNIGMFERLCTQTYAEISQPFKYGSGLDIPFGNFSLTAMQGSELCEALPNLMQHIVSPGFLSLQCSICLTLFLFLGFTLTAPSHAQARSPHHPFTCGSVKIANTSVKIANCICPNFICPTCRLGRLLLAAGAFPPLLELPRTEAEAERAQMGRRGGENNAPVRHMRETQ